MSLLRELQRADLLPRQARRHAGARSADDVFLAEQLEPVQARLEHERVQPVPLHDVGRLHVDFAQLRRALRDAAGGRDVPGGLLAGGLVAVAHTGPGPAAVDARLAGLRTPLVGRRRRHGQRVRQAAEVGPLTEVRALPRRDVFLLQHEAGLEQRLGIGHVDRARSRSRRSPSGSSSPRPRQSRPGRPRCPRRAPGSHAPSDFRRRVRCRAPPAPASFARR